MLFNSYIFILAFFPLFAAGYFLFGKMRDRRFALTFIIVMSLVFYGYNNVRHVPLILSSIAVNYLISRLLSREAWRNREHLRRALLAGGILFNTALIFYYKYYDFFFTNVNALFHTHVPMKGLLLPLGISFFTFQQISFLADSYRMTTAGYSIFEYAAFVTFFPQLVAGPIVLHSELIPQFRDPEKRKPDADRIADGICRFSAGLFKKVLIADTFAGAVAWGFANTESASPADLILVMLAYTFQIYFDFSGYCDMAAGIAETVNISLPINFDSPYRSATIREFWKRWHMTLTRFLTTYIYIPLGGNRRGMARTCLNMMIVYLVSGIWHGANWTFILWGVLHGLACILERIFEKPLSRVPRAVKWPVTFLTVNILWLLFRADSVEQWIQILKKMAAVRSFEISGALTAAFGLPFRDPYLPALLLFPAALILCLCFENTYRMKIRKNAATAVFAACILFLAILSLGRESVFLYFNF